MQIKKEIVNELFVIKFEFNTFSYFFVFIIIVCIQIQNKSIFIMIDFNIIINLIIFMIIETKKLYTQFIQLIHIH